QDGRPRRLVVGANAPLRRDPWLPGGSDLCVGAPVAGSRRAGVDRMRTMKRGYVALLFLLHGIGAAHAHGGDAEEAGPVWTFDPWITIALLVFGLLYARGLWRLWRRAAATGRGMLIRHAL